MNDGLSDEIRADIASVLEQYPQIRQACLFGSRAKGTYRDGSDIDLVIDAPAMDDATFTQLWHQLNDLPLIFKMDVLHWQAIQRPQLKAKIEAESQVFWRAESAGEEASI